MSCAGSSDATAVILTFWVNYFGIASFLNCYHLLQKGWFWLAVPKPCAFPCRLFQDQHQGLAARLNWLFQHCGLLITEGLLVAHNKSYFAFRHKQHLLDLTCSRFSTLVHCSVTYLSLNVTNIDAPYFPLYKTRFFFFSQNFSRYVLYNGVNFVCVKACALVQLTYAFIISFVFKYKEPGVAAFRT